MPVVKSWKIHRETKRNGTVTAWKNAFCSEVTLCLGQAKME